MSTSSSRVTRGGQAAEDTLLRLVDYFEAVTKTTVGADTGIDVNIIGGTVTASIGAAFDYGVSSAAIRTASQVGNASGAAAFGAGATSAQTLRVVLPTDQTAIPASQSGTWNITNISGTVSLPTGASTLAEQQTQTTALQLIDNLVLTQSSTTSGQSGILSMAAVSNLNPTLTDAQTSPLSLTTAGSLRTYDETNYIQNIVNAGYLSNIDSNIFTMSGYTSNLATMTTAYVLNNAFATGRGVPAMAEYDDTSTDVPSGDDRVYMLRMTANRGLHVNLRDVAGTSDLGSSISSSAAHIAAAAYSGIGNSFSDFLGTGGIVNDNPSHGTPYGAGEAAPFNISALGALYTTVIDAHGAEVDFGSMISYLTNLSSSTNTNNTPFSRGSPIMGQYDDVATGTVTENNVSTVRISSTRGLHVNPRTAAGAEIALAQGSTTSGQTGYMAMGAVTTSAPSYTNAQTSPLSLMTNGTLRVRHTDGTNLTPAGDGIGRSIYTITADGSGVFNLGSTVVNLGGFGAQVVFFVDPGFTSLDFAADGSLYGRVASTDNTLANGRYLLCDSNGALATYDNGSLKASYSASTTGLVPVATATDIWEITGSASKTVKITQLWVSGTAATAINTSVLLIKRSTANSGGTSSATTFVAHDSTNAAATATGKAYTANPTTGTAVGTIRSIKTFFSLGTAGGTVATWDFGIRPAQPIVLRGTSQQLCVNLNGATISTGSLDIWAEITEE